MSSSEHGTAKLGSQLPRAPAQTSPQGCNEANHTQHSSERECVERAESPLPVQGKQPRHSQSLIGKGQQRGGPVQHAVPSKPAEPMAQQTLHSGENSDSRPSSAQAQQPGQNSLESQREKAPTPPSPVRVSAPVHRSIALQQHPVSPAKRMAPEHSTNSEKRSRVHGPHSPTEQPQVAHGTKTDHVQEPESDGQPLASSCGRGSPSPSRDPTGPEQQPQSPCSTPKPQTPYPEPPQPCEMGREGAQHSLHTHTRKAIPPLALDRLPDWARHWTPGRPPGIARVPPAPRLTPSPISSSKKEGESEDEEMKSWMQEPQWEPSSAEGKGHIFKPVNQKELRQYEKLISELQPHQARQVKQIWEQMHEARQSCEHMTMRGVRAAKDVMTGWAGIAQDLMGRTQVYEQQVQELMQLTQRQALIIEELQLAANQSSSSMPSLLARSALGRSSSCRGCFSGNSSSDLGGRCTAKHFGLGGTPPTAGAAAEGSTPAQPHVPVDGAAGLQGNSSGSMKQRSEQQGGDPQMLLRLQEAERERVQLEGTNAELAHSLDNMTLLFSSAQEEASKLRLQLTRSNEHSALLQRKLDTASSPSTATPAAVQKGHRYGGTGTVPQQASEGHVRQPPKPFVPQAFRAWGVGMAGINIAQPAPFVSMRSGWGPLDRASHHASLQSYSLGNEYKRAAFRAMLVRGGVV